MFWLFFSPQKNHTAESVENLLEGLLGARHVVSQYGFGNLEAFLRTPHPIITHAMMVSNGFGDLRALQKYLPQITGWRLILGMTGDIDQSLAAEASRFRPRFTAHLPGELDQVRAVAEKMVRNAGSTTELPPTAGRPSPREKTASGRKTK
jgi:hypothetical protein